MINIQEISEKAKANKKQDKNPHFIGKGGYKANRDKWHQNEPIISLDNSLSSLDPSILSNDRSYDWVRARTKMKE